VVNVNQDTGNDHWWPWIAWDECTDMLAVVFMGSQDFASSIDSLDQRGAHTYIAVSPAPEPGESFVWQELKVSGASWCCDYTESYYDYIGIAAGDGRVFPVWSDNRNNPGTHLFHPYTSPVWLWGIEPESVTSSVTVADTTLTMTAT
jgi:hypothetical protein